MIKGLGLAVVISTVAIGCGGGSSGGSGGPGFNPSVPASTPLNKLSSSQAMQLCTDTGTYLNSSITTEINSPTFECQVVGIEVATLSFDATSSTNATVQKACQDAYTACLKAPPDAGADDVDGGTFTSDCTTTQGDIATCSATVGQYTACVDELTSVFTDAFPPCNQLTVAKLSASTSDAGTDPTTSGPACTALDNACPGATGDTSMTSSMLSAAKGTTRGAVRKR